MKTNFKEPTAGESYNIVENFKEPNAEESYNIKEPTTNPLVYEGEEARRRGRGRKYTRESYQHCQLDYQYIWGGYE